MKKLSLKFGNLLCLEVNPIIVIHHNGGKYIAVTLGTATTDSFGNFVFNWTVPEGDEPDSDDDYRLESFFRGSTYLNQQIVTNELTIMDETVNLIANLSRRVEYISNNFMLMEVADKGRR